MHLIVVTDIFGQTPELEYLISEVVNDSHIVQIVAPYENATVEFDSEDEAYNIFQRTCGIENLSGLLKTTISKSNPGMILLGFSVGASSIWKLSTCEYAHKVNKSICFYGSRIRDMVDLVPRFKTNLIFPKREERFSVDNLISAVEKKDNVVFDKTDYLHGFMNRRSVNFNEAGYQEYIEYLKLVIA